MNKVYPDAQAALHDVGDGAVILAGGFGLSGNPGTAYASWRASRSST
jgi:acyl CoA:acetate/3-ketoacid CoA transferase alpha subunit